MYNAWEGTLRVRVIIIGNGISGPSSNPGKDIVILCTGEETKKG